MRQESAAENRALLADHPEEPALSRESKLAWFGAVTGLLSVLFTGGIWALTAFQYAADEEDRARNLKQIDFQAQIERGPQDSLGGVFKIFQVSGTPTILNGVRVRASIETESGGFEEVEPFDLPLKRGIIEDGMPSFSVEDIGAQICHRRRFFGNLPCDPSFTFEVLYQYDVEGESRPYRYAKYVNG